MASIRSREPSRVLSGTMSSELVGSIVLAVLGKARRVSHASVAASVREESARELAQLGQNLANAKSSAVTSRDEDLANCILAAQLAVAGAQSELEMWRALENVQPGDAWSLLVEAQNQAACAARIDRQSQGYWRDVNHRLGMQLVLFPDQTYMSAGMIVHEAECSICGANYDECEHVKGRAYAGEMCARTIKRADLLEVSVVFEPSDKRCRVTSADGVDSLTLLPISSADGGNG